MTKKNTNAPTERWPKEITRNFTKMDKKWLISIGKDVQTFLVITNIQNKTRVWNHFTHQIGKQQVTNLIYFLPVSIPCDSTYLIFMKNSTLSSIPYLISKWKETHFTSCYFPFYKTLFLMAKWKMLAMYHDHFFLSTLAISLCYLYF